MPQELAFLKFWEQCTQLGGEGLLSGGCSKRNVSTGLNKAPQLSTNEDRYGNKAKDYQRLCEKWGISHSTLYLDMPLARPWMHQLDNCSQKFLQYCKHMGRNNSSQPLVASQNNKGHGTTTFISFNQENEWSEISKLGNVEWVTFWGESFVWKVKGPNQISYGFPKVST